jgi:hypothetical protein
MARLKVNGCTPVILNVYKFAPVFILLATVHVSYFLLSFIHMYDVFAKREPTTPPVHI